MTAALKAMVKAIDGEIDLQEAELNLGSGLFEVAHLDLEKIARAGLAALKGSLHEIAEMRPVGWNYHVAHVGFGSMIDKILEEKA